MAVVNELNRWLVVVPARLRATRLPRKPLEDLCGKPLVVRVYENLAPLASAGATIVVATDHTDIVTACQTHGVPAVMTDERHASGTDRCFEVAQKHNLPFILNVQGDEPFVNTEDLLALMRMTERDQRADITTLVYSTTDRKDLANPNVVKVAVGANQYALYFSRSAIPHTREPAQLNPSFLRHVGVYAFRKEALQRFCSLPPGVLEQTEKLEQLRALENQMLIKVHPASSLTIGIDTPAELEAARAYFKK